jgi:hypothetical protein
VIVLIVERLINSPKITNMLKARLENVEISSEEDGLESKITPAFWR